MQDFYQKTTTNTCATEGAETTVFLIPAQISAQKPQRNTKKEQNAIIRLSSSIRKYGLLEPIDIIADRDENGFLLYTVIDGVKRLHAAKLAGIQKIPCHLLAPNHPKCAKNAAINHLKSEKMHFFDTATHYQTLLNQFGMTQEEIAENLGISQSAVANKLRLLQLEKEEQGKIRQAGLCERHARALLRIKDAAARAKLLSDICFSGATVAQTEDAVAEFLGETAKNTQREPAEAPAALSVKGPEPPDGAPQAPLFSAVSPPSEENTPIKYRPVGVTPRKFALRDLTPLYNSIERTLGIFKKTGVGVQYRRAECEEYAQIYIQIPKKG